MEIARGPGAAGAQGIRLTDSFTWQYDLGVVKTSTINAHPVDGSGPTASLAYDVLGRVVTATDVDGSQVHTRYEWCHDQGGYGACRLPNATFLVAADVDYLPQGGGERRAAGASRTILDAFGRQIGAFSDRSGAPGELPGQYREFDDRGFIKRASTAPIAYADTAYFDDFVALPTYDVLGRVVSRTAPTQEDDEATSSTVYRGLQTEQSDNRGAVWRYTSDVLGRMVRVDNPDPLTGAFGAGATATTYTYTQFDELRSVTDPEQQETHATYNGLGWRETLTDPNSGTWQFQHNAFGELVQQVSPRQAIEGTATRWTYDRLGRMTQRTEAEGNTYWRYYDTADAPWRGMLHEVEYPVKLLAGGTRTERYAYDSLTRLSEWRDLGSDTAVGVAYDGVGRVEQIIYPEVAQGHFAVSYAYDERSRVSAATTHDGRTLYRANTFDRFGRATDIDLGNGVKVSAETDRAVGAVKTLVDAAANLAAIQHFSYEWDANGNTIARRDLKHEVTDSFAYDYMNSLTSHTVAQSQGGYTDDYTIG
ncbi:MAG: RHS repeat domain-containing protein, partial [Pseudomonadota bacterium]